MNNFKKLLEKLDGLNYCFFSGFVMFYYTNGKRPFNDIDILIDEKDIDKLAKRFGTNAEKRIIAKGNLVIEDYGFETNFLGWQIEVVTSRPGNKKEKDKVSFILKNKEKKEYENLKIFLEPLEELLARKSFFHRDKDINDLKLINDKKINISLLKKFAKNWGNEDNIFKTIKMLGFNFK